jgi:chromate transporter
VAFLALALFGVPFPIVVALAGLTGWALGRWRPSALPQQSQPEAADAGPSPVISDDVLHHESPSTRRTVRVLLVGLLVWGVPVAAAAVLTGAHSVFTEQGLFFSGAAVVTFGGAYAVLAYVAQQAVEHYGWLQPGEMLDGLGLAETTPGPLIMVLQFVGFLAGFRAPGTLPPLVSGTLAGLLTTWVTFVPCFLWIFAGAPLIGRLRGSRRLAGALSAITAAVAGVILNLAVWFGLRTLFAQVETVPLGPLRLDLPVPTSLDPAALALTLAAILAVFRFGLGTLQTLALCAGAGMLLRQAGLA